MSDHGIQRFKSSIVIAPSLEVCEQRADRRGPITLIGGAVGLEIVDTHFGGRVEIPAGVRPQRLDVTAVAFGPSAEQLVASGRRCGVIGRLAIDREGFARTLR